jgi:hypothetical protein
MTTFSTVHVEQLEVGLVVALDRAQLLNFYDLGGISTIFGTRSWFYLRDLRCNNLERRKLSIDVKMVTNELFFAGALRAPFARALFRVRLCSFVV